MPNTIDSSVVHIWAIKNNKLYCDTTSADITKGASTPTVSLYLFARNESGTASNIGSHKIYYAKIWNESGVLVFNGVPAKRLSDGAIGVYDTASETFITNSGTGTFIAGPEINPTLPAGYAKLEYIESSGTQYIELPDYFNADTEVEAEMSFNTITSPVAIWGVMSGTNTYYCFRISSNSAQGPVFGTASLQVALASYVQTGTKYKFKQNKNGVYIDSTLYAYDTGTVSDFTTVREFWLLGAKSSSSSNKVDGRLYSAVVRQNGVVKYNLIPCKNASGVIGMYDTISGSFFTNAGTGTFAAGSAWTAPAPTPDAPIDIICNNGALKARTKVPQAYTELEYIKSDGTAYLDTGVVPTPNTAYEIVAKFDADVGNTNLIGSGYGSTGAAENAFMTTNSWSTGAYEYKIVPDISHAWQNYTATTTIKRSLYLSTTEFKVDGVVAGTNSDPVPDTGYQSFFVFQRWRPSVSTANDKVAVYGLKFWESGVLTHNFIPAKRNSDGVIGMYDTVSNTFFTNAGTGTFTAGAEIPTIYTDGTVETINVLGKNLWAINPPQHVAVSTSGGWNTGNNYTGGAFKVPCKPNTNYTVSWTHNGTDTTNTIYWGFWDGAGNFIGRYTNGTPTYTTPANAAYLTAYYYINGGTTINEQTTMQIEEGSTATEYEPYYDGGTATCEDLLSISTYTDEQEVITGAVTRKVGVVVFDGTEEWAQQGTSNNVYTLPTTPYPADFASNPDNNVGFCTHFQVVARSTTVSSYLTNGQMGWNQSGKIMFKHSASQADVANWKAFLAAQYAAGTPVIIVYPLATATTETVTGQPMNTVQGDNTLEITQASLDGLELECRYFKGK